MMNNRLTYRDGNGRAYLNGSIETCAERLAAYEDLGLLPEQLQELDKLYREKCEELVALEKSLNDKDNSSIESRMIKAWKEHIVGRFTKVE